MRVNPMVRPAGPGSTHCTHGSPIWDWDATLGMTTPGQSGDPESPFYDNLFPLWAADRVFPVFYSRERIEGVTAERVELQPGG
jgi:acyl-homoserine lactone acylase PvdQ